VTFEPYLAGERTSIDQRFAAFSGLTLSTTRRDMLEAVIESLARASAERVPLLQSRGTRIRHDVFATGGASGLSDVLHRDWPGKWTFHGEDEATLRGLGTLTPRER
jgi:sugar (pentulose or hexulose) kinase